MLQALPVMYWAYGFDNGITSVELIDDMDNSEKDNKKEEGKDSKEKNIAQKYYYNKRLPARTARLALLPSGNAVILHHADINTPPPDINA